MSAQTANRKRNYVTNRDFSDRHMLLCKQKLGAYLFQDATIEQDTKQCTDIVLLSHGNRIGVRLRRYGYAREHRYDVTFRYKLRNGCETEWSKINKGWGDLFFYAHLNEKETAIDLCYLLQLEGLRDACRNWCDQIDRHDGKRGIDVRSNRDGTKFLALDVRLFDAPGANVILIADPPLDKSLQSGIEGNIERAAMPVEKELIRQTMTKLQSAEQWQEEYSTVQRSIWPEYND